MEDASDKPDELSCRFANEADHSTPTRLSSLCFDSTVIPAQAGRDSKQWLASSVCLTFPGAASSPTRSPRRASACQPGLPAYHHAIIAGPFRKGPMQQTECSQLVSTMHRHPASATSSRLSRQDLRCTVGADLPLSNPVSSRAAVTARFCQKAEHITSQQ